MEIHGLLKGEYTDHRGWEMLRESEKNRPTELNKII